MGESSRGPVCTSKAGEDFVSTGTMARTSFSSSSPTGCQEEQQKDAFKSPAIDSCVGDLQDTLPRAHVRALAMLTTMLDYFTNLRAVVVKEPSLKALQAAVSEDLSYLSLKWKLGIDDDARTWLKAKPNPSKGEMDKELLPQIDSILTVYKRIKDGLEGDEFEYECEYKADLLYSSTRCTKGTRGYVWHAKKLNVAFGDIHLCVDEIEDLTNPVPLAALIIHEASHKFAETDDSSDVPWENAHTLNFNQRPLPGDPPDEPGSAK